jgi:hypothetical protein
MSNNNQGNRNFNESNVEFSIQHNSIFVWREHYQRLHPLFLHNRMEFDWFIDRRNLDIITLLDLLQGHLTRIESTIGIDQIIPGYSEPRFHLARDEQRYYSLSVVFICQRDYSEVEFSELIDRHFREIIQSLR